MGAVATEAQRRLGQAAAAQHAMHARGIRGEDGGVTGLAGDRVHRLGRALHHGVRRMAAGANRGVRVAFADQRRVDACVPLLELIGVAGAADLDHGDGKRRAGWRSGFTAARMTGQVDVGMAAGAADRAVDRLRKRIAGYVQRERSAARPAASRAPACHGRPDIAGRPRTGHAADAGAVIAASASTTAATAAPIVPMANGPRPILPPKLGFVTCVSVFSPDSLRPPPERTMAVFCPFRLSCTTSPRRSLIQISRREPRKSGADEKS